MALYQASEACPGLISCSQGGKGSAEQQPVQAFRAAPAHKSIQPQQRIYVLGVPMTGRFSVTLLSGHAKRKDDQRLEFSITWLHLSEAVGLLSSFTASFPIEQPGIYEEKEISISSVAISIHCWNAGPLVLKGKSPLHCPQSRALAVHEENIAASGNGWIQGTRISGCCSVIPSP